MKSKKSFEVCKFGGTSLAGTNEISQVIEIIKSKNNSVTICSAMGGITDLLITTAETSAYGHKVDIEEAAAEFAIRHNDVIRFFVKNEKIKTELIEYIEHQKEELITICQSLSTLRELTPRTLAKIVARGERSLAKIIAGILIDQDYKALYIDATDFLVVDSTHFNVIPNMDICTKRATERLYPHLEAGSTVVVPGFIAENESGELVTLGRSGSDYSASLIAASIKASQVSLYKEVEGLLTADPRYVKNARLVPEMHYREASELAYYGAKILHPRTIVPLQDGNIPLLLKSTFSPNLQGTRIAGDVSPGAYPVRALTAVTRMVLMTVEGKSAFTVPDMVSRTFSALNLAKVSVSMVSQASSEACVCFLVHNSEAQNARETIDSEFRYEMERSLIYPVKAQPDVALIALVGLGMNGTSGICGRAFGALGVENINVLAIAQGSTELNISIIIEEKSIPQALEALHREYHLQKLKALANTSGTELSVSILGFGNIGRTLVNQIVSQKTYFESKLGLYCNTVGVGDTSGMVIDDKGFSQVKLSEFIQSKANGTPLLDSGKRFSIQEYTELLKGQLFNKSFDKGIFVDVTAEETNPLLLEAIRSGMHVAMANKKPLSVPFHEYEELFQSAKDNRVIVRYEATAGAGLPIFDTLGKLVEAGDTVEAVLGCLSGTLGYIMTEVEDGAKFSEAVEKAYKLGYTEPDPREDLSGMDVARKALIIARNLGRKLDLKDIQLEPLFPKSVDDDNASTFIQNLKKIDEEFGDRIKKAASENKVLRYVASLTGSEVKVGIEAVDRDAPLGRLRGTDNQVTIKSQRYSSNPLIVTGPGAGAAVTAAGVLNDILAIAATTERNNGF